MENENTIGGKIGTFVGGIGNKVSDAANDIGQTVECALDIVKDKAGNLIGLIKDKAGNVLEKVTNKESIDNIVQGVRKAGRIALFASALGVVLGISSCTTTNTLTYGELAPTPNRGTTITIPNAKKGYVEKQEEVTTHIIMADPGLTAEFKASNINLEQTPEFMSGAHAGVKGAPDANKMRQIRNDNVIDVLNSVSGSYLERAFSYEETRRLRDDKINPLHFTFEQCRSTALADAQANPTKKEMYNVGIQIIQLDEQTDFLENLRFVRSGQLRKLDPTDDHGNERGHETDINRYNLIALEYEKANPDAATYDVIDMMWQIRFMGAENTAVDRFSQDSGQQDLQIHYLSLLRNKLDDEYSRHEVRIKTLLKRKLVGTEQERVKQGAGIDRLGQKETLDILFKQVNGKVIAASFFSGVDLVPEFAEKLKKVLPQESKNLAGYYAYLYLDGIIVGMNDYVYNAAYLASPETDYSKKGVAGEKAENDFYAMVEAIKELAGNMRIVSASTSGGITSVNTALTKLLSRMPNGALSGKLNVAGELRDKSTNGIAILLNQLAGELADMMPDNFGSYALRNEFARFFVEEYKGIGFTRDLIDERGYDEDKILLTAPAPSTVSTSTNTENNSVGYSDDDEEESPAPDTGRVQADDVSGGITGNQKE